MRKAKEKEEVDRCAEIKILLAKQDNFNVYKRVSKARGLQR